MNQIGATIRRLRKLKGITQTELKEKCGISQTYISQIESGERTPSIEILTKISAVLEIPFPVLSFLSLDSTSIAEEKRSSYKLIEPAIKSMIEEFFLADLNKF